MDLEPKLIVIDDDSNYPRIMQEAIRLAGLPAKIEWHEDSENAFKQLETDAQKSPNGKLPYLVFLDINIPGMSGFEFLKSVRRSPLLMALPVFMFSVSQSPNDIRLSYSLGANAYLTKPADFQKLQEMLRSIYQFWFHWVHFPSSKTDS